MIHPMTPRDLRAEDADDPRKRICIKCDIDRHDGCLWKSRPTSCDCPCPWLEADAQQHFPSLRGIIRDAQRSRRPLLGEGRQDR